MYSIDPTVLKGMPLDAAMSFFEGRICNEDDCFHCGDKRALLAALYPEMTNVSTERPGLLGPTLAAGREDEAPGPVADSEAAQNG